MRTGKTVKLSLYLWTNSLNSGEAWSTGYVKLQNKAQVFFNQPDMLPAAVRKACRKCRIKLINP
jgi:hypothetical protein